MVPDLLAKLAKAKERRASSKGGGGLGDNSAESMLSASEWVKRSRRVESARSMSARGPQKPQDGKDEGKGDYSSNDLKGLHVKLDAGDLGEGEDVILTLADSNILDTDEHGKAKSVNDAEDLLENVNLADEDKRRAAEKRKKRAKHGLYSGYDDDEFEEGYLAGGPPKILSKYDDDDENLTTRTAPRMVIGANNASSSSSSGAVAIAASSTAIQAESLPESKRRKLESAEMVVVEAEEYLDEAEMKKFKKRDKKRDKKDKKGKKGRRMRSKVKEEEEGGDAEEEVKANIAQAVRRRGRGVIFSPDLGKDVDVDVGDDMQVDHGGGGGGDNGNGSAGAGGDDEEDALLRAMEEKQRQLRSASSAFALHAHTGQGSHVGGTKVTVKQESVDADADADADVDADADDDADAEIAASIARARRLARANQGHLLPSSKGSGTGAEWAQRMSSLPLSQDEQAALAFSGQQESDTRLGFAHIKVERAWDNEDGAAEEGREREVYGTRRRDRDQGDTHSPDPGERGMTAVKHGQQGSSDDDDEEEKKTANTATTQSRSNKHSASVIDVAGASMAALSRERPVAKAGLAATLAMLKDSGDLALGESLAGRAKDRRTMDPSSRDFDVKLEYRDEFGRKMTQKEAFRQLNYAFHGYGPGKKSQEKRLRQLAEDRKLREAQASLQTGSLKALQSAQSSTGQAHVVLGAVSGGVEQGKLAVERVVRQLKRKEEKEKGKGQGQNGKKAGNGRE